MKYFLPSRYYLNYVSGPHYDDLDKNHKISLWNLCFHVQAGPAGVHTDTNTTAIFPAFYYPIEAANNQAVSGFTRLFQMDFLPAYHRQSHWNLIVHMTKWFSYLGNTSYCQDVMIKNALTGEPLTSGTIHNVRVDFKLRQPVKIPKKWFSDIDSEQLTRRKPPQGFKQPPQPAKSYLYTVAVTCSCVDSNQHQNMAIHLKNCWDAGSAAACSNQLTQFNTELVYYNLKQVSFLYQGEVVIGDVLQVACWEHPSECNTLCFTMNKGSEVIGQCQMEFYPDSSNLLKHQQARL